MNSSLLVQRGLKCKACWDKAELEKGWEKKRRATAQDSNRIKPKIIRLDLREKADVPITNEMLQLKELDILRPDSIPLN